MRNPILISAQITLLAILLSLNVTSSYAVGEYSNGLSARGAAMGGAFVALVDDASAVYWNPAGLTRISNKQIAVNFELRAKGDSLVRDGSDYKLLSMASFAYPFKNSALGVSYSKPESYSTNVKTYDLNTDNSLENYSLSYGYSVNDKLSIGGSLNYYILNYEEQGWYNLYGQGVNYNLGAIYFITDNVSLGITYRPETKIDYTTITYYTRNYPKYDKIPATTAAGIAYEDSTIAFEIGGRLTQRQDDARANILYGTDETTYRAGFEYKFFEGRLPLRVGYNKIMIDANDIIPSGTTESTESFGIGAYFISDIFLDISFESRHFDVPEATTKYKQRVDVTLSYYWE